MKRSLIIILSVATFSLSSCKKIIREFNINKGVEQWNLKLYSDSTFVERITEMENNYKYSGKWTGELDEGKTFMTVATKWNGKIITATPTHKYKIVNGKAVEIEIK